MTKKHFEEIARAIAAIDDETDAQMMVLTMVGIGNDLNPRFSEKRFRDRVNELRAEFAGYRGEQSGADERDDDTIEATDEQVAEMQAAAAADDILVGDNYEKAYERHVRLPKVETITADNVLELAGANPAADVNVNQAEIIDAFIDETQDATTRAGEIADALVAHLGNSHDQLNWGHVGTMKRIAELLDETQWTIENHVAAGGGLAGGRSFFSTKVRGSY